MQALRLGLPAVLALLIGCGLSAATELYVSPDGKADADGTKARPLDLATALGAKGLARPGDTVWLLGGTYRGGFTAKVAGKEGSPITFRQAPGERATIDCRVEGKGQTLFQVDGAWLVFWGFEVTCSDPKRDTDEKGSAPADINRGGVNVLGSQCKCINLVVHDTAQGFGFWSSGEGGEICGCIIYNNGWTGPDRGHGHAIYTQNKTGTKRLVDNIMFNQFCYGIHAYGSPRAFLVGYHIEGNVAFNNGAASRPTDRAPNILVGAGSPSERIMLVSNYTYHTGLGGSVQLGYGALNKDLALRDNYFVGGMSVRWWEKVVGSGNTFVAGHAVPAFDCAKCGDPTQYEWNKNTYFPSEKSVFSLTTKEGGKALSFEDWQKATGLDKDSTFTVGAPTGVKVFVRPNPYEPGRANVIVYNWDKKDAVDVDLKDALKSGAKYRVMNAQDFFGKPVVEGTFDGKPVRLPMKEYRAPAPVGKPDYVAPATGPEFNVFVVLPM